MRNTGGVGEWSDEMVGGGLGLGLLFSLWGRGDEVQMEERARWITICGIVSVVSRGH